MLLMHEHIVRLRNDGNGPREVAIEPWGDTHWLQAGETLEVRGLGPDGGQLMVDQSDELWEVWGWSGSTVRVFVGSGVIASWVTVGDIAILGDNRLVVTITVPAAELPGLRSVHIQFTGEPGLVQDRGPLRPAPTASRSPGLACYAVPSLPHLATPPQSRPLAATCS